MTHFRDVPIPDRMRGLPLDDRGYPIPVIVLRDRSGRPHFTVNAQEVVEEMIFQDRCSICGGGHDRRRWFVGGPMSAFHPNGSYMDPPLHAECMRYAMRVCPWLGIVRFRSRIDGGTMSTEEIERTRVVIDRTMIPGKPAVFVCVGADSQVITTRTIQATYLRPERPYKAVEYWRDGKQLEAGVGEALARAAVHEMTDATPR